MGFDSSLRRKIKLAAKNEKSKLKESEIFLSDELRRYLENLSSSLTDDGHSSKVKLLDGERDGVVACTNGNNITINVNSDIVQYFPETEQKFMALMGLFFHEMAHNIFLDFNEAKRALRFISEGHFYGDKPTGLSAKEEADWVDMEAAMANPAARAIFASVFKELSNIVSDTHDEDAMIDRFGSFTGEGIFLCRSALHASCDLFEDMKAQALAAGGNDLALAYNLLLQETRFGDVLCKDEHNLENSEFGEMLKKVRQHARIACATDDSVRQFTELTYITLYLWPFIRAQIQQTPPGGNGPGGDPGGSGDNNSPPTGGGSGTGTGDGPSNQPQSGKGKPGKTCVDGPSTPGTQSGGQITEVQVREILKQLENGAKKAGTTQSPENMTSSQTAIDRRSAERRGKKPSNDGSAAGDAEKSEKENRDGPPKSSASDPIYIALDNICQQIAEARAEQKAEKEAKANVEAEVRTIIAANANSPHRGVPLALTRNLNVSDGDRQTYESAMRDLLPISKRLQRQIEDALRDMKDGYLARHKIGGNILIANDAYRPDGRCFASKKLPQDYPDMAVSVLVDHSGSMCGERIETAMRAAMLLYDFATGINIPIAVAGHRSSAGNSVEYITYADFEQYSKNDRYRIAKMSASGCNRDGMALMIAAGLLEKRPEEVKLLIIISDGRPNHQNYGGEGAKRDIQGIVRSCKRKGIEVIAAAIGNDRKQIQEIYQDEFLDISDLSKLPRIMTNIVKKRVLRNAL